MSPPSSPSPSSQPLGYLMPPLFLQSNNKAVRDGEEDTTTRRKAPLSVEKDVVATSSSLLICFFFFLFVSAWREMQDRCQTNAYPLQINSMIAIIFCPPVVESAQIDTAPPPFLRGMQRASMICSFPVASRPEVETSSSPSSTARRRRYRSPSIPRYYLLPISSSL